MNIDAWMHANMESILWVIEVLWVGGVLSIIAFYFVLKYKVKRNKKKHTSQSKE